MVCNVDRIELRFRILFEYYQEHHSEYDSMNSAYARIKNMKDISDAEKRAAKTWLIDEGYVEGYTQSRVNPSLTLSIKEINHNGINFVESVMDSAFMEIKNECQDISQLSKTDKIKKFAQECLKYPVTSEICKITYEAIIKYINSNIT